MMDKRTLVIRNTTLENVFPKGFNFSGYDNWEETEIENSELIIWFYQISLLKTSKDRISEVESFRVKVLFLIKQCELFKKPLLILTLPFVNDSGIENQANSLPEVIANFNSWLFSLKNRFNKVWIIDINKFENLSEIISNKFYYTSLIGINPKIATSFSDWIRLQIDILYGRHRKKCLVIDLDNTLWSGVLGEDGKFGIQYNGQYPGNIFNYLQKQIQELADSGILIAVCSKNNFTDVEDFWVDNGEMGLNWDSVLIKKINWNDKASNILEIANELNIGLESIVFFDDNPTEREWVKKSLPLVEVPDFPDKFYEIPDFINRIIANWFQRDYLLNEDRDKINQYKVNQLRQELSLSMGSLKEYLIALKVSVSLTIIEDGLIPRVSQMTKKTNQFNFSQMTFEENELFAKITDNRFLVYCIYVSDKFGDYGLTGAIFGQLNEANHFEMLNFLLSCRVLGKNVENEAINALRIRLREKGVMEIVGRFKKTNRNTPAFDFLIKNADILNENNDLIDFKIDIQ